MRKKFVSIRRKLTTMAIVMLVLSVFSISAFSYYKYSQYSIKMQGNIALASVCSISAAIDAEKFKAFASSDDRDLYYFQMKDIFDTARINTKMLFLYAMVKAVDGINYKYIYVSGDNNFSEFDTIESYGAPPLEAYNSGINTVSEIYKNGDRGYMISAFAPIKDVNGNIIGLVGADISADDVMSQLGNYRNRVILAAGLSVMLFSIVAFTYTGRLLGKPIKSLAELSKKIAKGEFDVKVDIKTNDEIGLLADSFQSIENTLSRLTFSIHEMSEVHVGGRLDYFIDAEQFTGAYRTIINGTNEMVKDYVDKVWAMLTTLKGFGEGDFGIELYEFPGQKKYANVAIETLRTIFTGLSSEIGALAVSAANGDLSNKIDINKYEGDWRSLAQELNKLMEAIRSPISESVSILRQMADGDFGARVKGAYKGDFGLIKDSLNDTMDKTSLYISEISDVLSKISSQNLKTYIDREYIGDFSRIKSSINMIVEKFNYVLSEINTSADKVAEGAKQISDLSNSLAQGASEQAAAAEELSSSTGYIAVQTDKSSDRANKANELAAIARQNAEMGNVKMKTMVAAMEDISEASSSISNIIKTIDDIAFQTNLLALNAAVEAARAGVHGKGFAVVAEEVRNLAGRSKIAAQETSVLIADSINKASEGTRVSEEMAKSLAAIVTQISEVSEWLNIIAKASVEQSSNIAQINQGIAQVSQVTQSNSSLSEESASAAEELSRQADLFRNEVAKFELFNS